MRIGSISTLRHNMGITEYSQFIQHGGRQYCSTDGSDTYIIRIACSDVLNNMRADKTAKPLEAWEAEAATEWEAVCTKAFDKYAEAAAVVHFVFYCVAPSEQDLSKARGWFAEKRLSGALVTAVRSVAAEYEVAKARAAL